MASRLVATLAAAVVLLGASGFAAATSARQVQTPQEDDFLKGVYLPEASGLRALVHPLTDDDVADHTALAHWIGEPVELDLATLDPPGVNQGVARFGKTDF